MQQKKYSYLSPSVGDIVKSNNFNGEIVEIIKDSFKVQDESGYFILFHENEIEITNPIYFNLKIKLKDHESVVISDEMDHFVQRERGSFSTRLRPGNYNINLPNLKIKKEINLFSDLIESF